MPEYLIVLPIDPMPEGTSYRCGESLPLHCTVMHWFKRDVGCDKDRFHNDILFITNTSQTIELISEVSALFGPASDVPVYVLQRNVDLLLLHTRLFKFLAEVHSLPDRLDWIGAGYRPHVTTCNGRSFTPGTTHKAESLVLIERKDDGTKVVVVEHQLGDIPF